MFTVSMPEGLRKTGARLGIAAIRYYDEAIRQDPKNEYAWYIKAMALRMLHRDSEAKAAYPKARELGYSGTMTLI